VRRYDYKTSFVAQLLDARHGQPTRLLDLGSGTSKDFVEILRSYPHVDYTGVEPNAGARHEAARLLAGRPNVTLVGEWGEALSRRFPSTFDLTLSLSVLEHVKYLDAFLATSVAVTKPGGQVVHRYDLGHALHPVSWVERVLVFGSMRVPWLVPATIFTGGPHPRDIQRSLAAHGIVEPEITYAQMPSLKAAMNRVPWDEGEPSLELGKRIVALDAELAARLRSRMDDASLMKLFPSITVSGVRGS
jgi:SAM-dependent methyltransferase